MRLKITLKSDLCAAAGTGFSSVIDNDACFDRYGLPYIPARRIKGCLREAACFIDADSNVINRLFGTAGGGFGEGGLLRISDARLSGFMEMQREIEKNNISPESVTNLFGDVRSATAIENDTAKKNSLRFTRVVSKCSPFDPSQELAFYSDIELDTDDSSVIEVFKNCCSALRNIGYRRNRGLGSVRCVFCPDETEEKEGIEEREIPDSFDDEVEYRIDIAVKLRDDLMIPQSSGTASIDYIPGTMVLGAIASKYNKKQSENRPADFNRIFLSGEVSFGNFYICDENKAPSFPAPLYLGKIKGTDKIVNMYSYKGEEIIKPLKKTYVSDYAVAKVAEKTVYHHSRTQETLYTQECIEAGQMFAGTIICAGKHAECITDILVSGTLSFGRSKNAQYSCCDIIKVVCRENTPETVEVSKTARTAAVLRSDLIIDIDSSFTEKTVLEAIFPDENVREKLTLEYSSLLSGTVSGYNSKWNLKRPHCSCIKAGSVLIFSCSAEMSLPRFINAGMRMNEGFGRCEIIPDADRESPFVEYQSDKKAEKESIARIAPLISQQKKKDRLINAALGASKEAVRYQMPNPALVGRATLMAKEAVLVKSDRWNNFERRVSSIKSEESRKKIQQLIGILDRHLTQSDCTYTDSERLRAVIYYMNIIKYLIKCRKNDSPADGGAK